MLTATDRTALTALAVHLEPGADPSVLANFIRDHRDACAGELSAVPGLDQLRAIILRFLRDAESLRAAQQSLDAYGEQLEEVGRSLLLRRHPAWAGIARLEIAGGPERATDDDLADAIAIANVGFATAADSGELGDGEALWAMAEQAESVRWTDRFEWLIQRAATAPFADDAHRAEVQLLLGLHRAERGQDGAASALEAAANNDAAEVRTRVHAAWVLAHHQAPPQAAREWLTRALEWLDEEDDPTVRERIDAALEALGDER